jgi:DNA-binding GntR family transcriptional regulator
VQLIEAGDAEGAEELAAAHAELGRQRTLNNIVRLLSTR